MMTCFHCDDARPVALVVEDEDLTRERLVECIEECGARVVAVATADEAWAHLSGGARVDVLFTDNVVPGDLSGAQLAALTRRRFPETPILLASGFIDTRTEWDGMILWKPYSIARTAAEIARIAAARTAERDSAA
jgi:CheY-like chemotaxis protein